MAMADRSRKKASGERGDQRRKGLDDLRRQGGVFWSSRCWMMARGSPEGEPPPGDRRPVRLLGLPLPPSPFFLFSWERAKG